MKILNTGPPYFPLKQWSNTGSFSKYFEKIISLLCRSAEKLAVIFSTQYLCSTFSKIVLAVVLRCTLAFFKIITVCYSSRSLTLSISCTLPYLSVNFNEFKQNFYCPFIFTNFYCSFIFTRLELRISFDWHFFLRLCVWVSRIISTKRLF